MLSMIVAGDLSRAEQRVWDAFPAAKLVDFGIEKAEEDDATSGEGWGPERQVRAEVLAALLCGAIEVEPGQAGGIHLARARIIGKLDLPGATFKHSLRLYRCFVEDGLDLSEATTRRLSLSGSYAGAMRLYRTKINGAFILTGAHLKGQDGDALSASGLAVTADMVCDDGFQAEGGINLCGARIGGVLSFSGARLDGKDGRAYSPRRSRSPGACFAIRSSVRRKRSI